MSRSSGAKSDGELYELAVARDRDAVRELVVRHHAQLVLYIRSKTDTGGVAEDSAAEAWLRFFRHLDDVGSERTKALRQPESIRFWLYRTALNAMRDQFRSSSRQSDLASRATAEARAMGITVYNPDELAAVEGDERRAALRGAFSKLDERCQELLTLLSADPPLSYQEVAEVLDRPIGSLGPTRRRCLDQLRRHMGVAA